jgi:signal transduction histidine kinase
VKVFDEAVLKLTAVYTAILLVVTIGFSVAFYFVTDAQLNRPLRPRFDDTVYQTVVYDDDQVYIFMQQRDDEVRMSLLAQLVVIDLSVLVAGAVASYFLARRTLRPIQGMTERQANFISDASHELRTPLAAMQMENEVLLNDKKAKSGDYQKQVKSNLEELHKMTDLTERLLEITQTDKLELTDVDARKIVEIAARKMAKTAQHKNVEMTIKVGKLKLRTNAAALEQILLILLDNAIKYSPAGSHVTIGSGKQKLCVVDEGEGIKPKDLPHIFDRFYRAEKSRSSSGYGLGLSLAQRLAEKMNMKITAKNGKTHGAIFWIEKIN